MTHVVEKMEHTGEIEPPHWFYYLTEPHRAMAEHIGFASSKKLLTMQHAGGGDGRP